MPEFSILHSLAMIRPNTQKVTSEFLLWAFRTHHVKVQMELGTQSIGVPDLGLDKIGNLLFPIPEIAEQEIITEHFKALNSRVRTEESYLDKLKLQKRGLMHDLLTGKVRVNVIGL